MFPFAAMVSNPKTTLTSFDKCGGKLKSIPPDLLEQTAFGKKTSGAGAGSRRVLSDLIVLECVYICTPEYRLSRSILPVHLTDLSICSLLTEDMHMSL